MDLSSLLFIAVPGPFGGEGRGILLCFYVGVIENGSQNELSLESQVALVTAQLNR